MVGFPLAKNIKAKALQKAKKSYWLSMLSRSSRNFNRTTGIDQYKKIRAFVLVKMTRKRQV
jgi:hypothetical protein